MNATMSIRRPKDLLERKPISKGDFVTMNDDSEIVKLYVVKSIDRDFATVVYLDLTYEIDTVELKEMVIPSGVLIYTDESFVSVGGLLWQIRDAVLSDTKRAMCNIDILI